MQKAGEAGSTTGTYTGTFGSNSTRGNTLLALLVSDAGGTAFTGPSDWVQVAVAREAADDGVRAEVWKYVNNPGGIKTASFTCAGSRNVNGGMIEYAPSASREIVDIDRISNPGIIFPAKVGDNCERYVYDNGKQATAITNWQNITGRTLAVRRVYFTTPPTGGITFDLQADASAGRWVALSFQPAYDPISSTQRTNLDNFLFSCKAAGLKAIVTMYHEPANKDLSPTDYSSVQSYYGPTVRKYYPLNYSAAADGGPGSVANYLAYYSAAKYARAVFDAASVDYYCPAYINDGLTLDSYAAITDPDNLPFGILEFGANQNNFTSSQIQSFYTAIQNYVTGRVSAGKGVTCVCHFTASPPGSYSQPPFTSGDYEVAYYQSLYDAVNGSVPSGFALEVASSQLLDAAVAIAGLSFSAEQTGNGWTVPAGWSHIAGAANGAQTLAFDSNHIESLAGGPLSLTNKFSTSQNAAGWAGLAATLAASA